MVGGEALRLDFTLTETVSNILGVTPQVLSPNQETELLVRAVRGAHPEAAARSAISAAVLCRSPTRR